MGISATGIKFPAILLAASCRLSTYEAPVPCNRHYRRTRTSIKFFLWEKTPITGSSCMSEINHRTALRSNPIQRNNHAMPTPEIQELTRFLSEGIVLAEPEELQHLADLHEKLSLIAALLRPDSPQLSTTATDAAAEIERIIMRECEDGAAVLKGITASICALQTVILDGRELKDVPFFKASLEAASAQSESDTQPAQATSAPSTTHAPKCDLPAEPLPLTGDSDLTAEFITESREHLDAANVSLLSIESNSADAEALNALFRAFHTIKGVAGFLELKPIQALAHETETLLDKCRKGEIALVGVALDVVFDATDIMKQLVSAVADALAGNRLLHPHPALPGLLPRIQAATEGRKIAAPVTATAATGAAKKAPDTSTQAEAAIASAPASSPANPSATDVHAESSSPIDVHAEPAHPANTAEGKPGTGPTVVKETVRVDAERLDKLVDIIGEMVIAEAMVSQSSENGTRGSSPSARLMNHLDKITRELQELAMSLRMVPVRTSFQRMARLARDVSKKLDKPIEFATAGDETELDKNVVDAIGDPLVHMVRNAIDHGIEDNVEDRRSAGKPDAGRIELRAFHKGGCIYIEIEDDGRGLDPARILAKARERGLIKEGETMTESEVFNLVFEPGFSTAKTITDVSGRGVGLDVVKRNIQALRGQTEIRSVKGKGTVFSIRLPLTLAIIEGMVFRLGEHRYIVPTLSIVRMIRPNEKDLTTVFSRGEMLKLGDRLVPLHRLERLFTIDGAIKSPHEAAVIVVEHDNRQVAFLVDELLGQQQIVIKPLGAMLRQYPGFTGGAIMPDGRVGLILDIAGLTAMAGVPESGCRAA